MTTTDNGIVRIWDTKTWSAELLDAGEGAALALAISPDGTRIAAGYKSGAIGIWSFATKKLEARIGGHPRDRGTCDDLKTQAWVDDAHRAIVAAACAADAQPYFDSLAQRTRQRLDGEIDVVWAWAAKP